MFSGADYHSEKVDLTGPSSFSISNWREASATFQDVNPKTPGYSVKSWLTFDPSLVGSGATVLFRIRMSFQMFGFGTDSRIAPVLLQPSGFTVVQTWGTPPHMQERPTTSGKTLYTAVYDLVLLVIPVSFSASFAAQFAVGPLYSPTAWQAPDLSIAFSLCPVHVPPSQSWP